MHRTKTNSGWEALFFYTVISMAHFSLKATATPLPPLKDAMSMGMMSEVALSIITGIISPLDFKSLRC
jgi:hypothetical protein